MGCYDCVHKSVCHSAMVVDGLLEKIKDEMMTNMEGLESNRYHIKPARKSCMDRIMKIDEAIKRFEQEIIKSCKHYKEKTSDAKY